MSVLVYNNENITVGKNITVEHFLIENGIVPSIVMVRINDQIVSRDKYSTYVIPDGAVVKTYPFVGGG